VPGEPGGESFRAAKAAGTCPLQPEMRGCCLGATPIHRIAAESGDVFPGSARGVCHGSSFSRLPEARSRWAAVRADIRGPKLAEIKRLQRERGCRNRESEQSPP